MRIFIFITFIALLTNAFSQADNKRPMYGEVQKTKEQEAANEKFINTVLVKYGTKEKASDAYTEIAWAYFFNDSLILSMKRFNQAWMLNPKNPATYFGFAGLMEIQGDTILASRLYQLGIEKDKGNKKVEACYQRLADCKEHLNDIKGTIAAYEKIILINPKNNFSYKKLGFLYSTFNEFSSSLKNYSKPIDLDPKDPTTYNNRGYLYQSMKNFDNAIVDYTKAIELDNTYISAYVNRGLCKMELQDYTGAKNDFITSTKLDPNSGELFPYLGRSKLELNDDEGACEDFQIAAKLGDHQVHDLIKKNCL